MARRKGPVNESEDQFRSLANVAPVMVWRSDSVGRCDWFNLPWLEFTGRSMEQEIGMGWIDGVYPEDREHCLQIYQNAVDTRQPFRMEYRLRHHSGEYRWILDTGAALYTGPKRVFSGYIGSCIDINDLKQAREAQESLARESSRLSELLQLQSMRQKVMLREILGSITEDHLILCDTASDLPTRLSVCNEEVVLTVHTLRLLRHQAEKAAEQIGLPVERTQDLLTAIGEAGMNAVVHAGGGRGSVCTGEQIQVWIMDNGTGISDEILHKATLQRGYSSTGSLGHGFWMILRTVDRLYLLTGPTGTTVVLEQNRSTQEPIWARNYFADSDIHTTQEN